MVLGHIKIAPMPRGNGLGAGFAAEVFDRHALAKDEISLTCRLLRRVALTNPHGARKFNLGN